MTEYLKRTIEFKIKEYLKSCGCLVIKGPKWCGKSTTTSLFANSIIELQKPNIYRQYKLLSDLGDPQLLFGKRPILFDEWQKIPDLWDYIRSDIDEKHGKGDFLLTGSTILLDKSNLHSGTGRFKTIKMGTMSLYESNESTGEISLRKLFDNVELDNTYKSSTTLSQIVYYICRGGWPEAVIEKSKEIALKAPYNYIDTLCDQDMQDNSIYNKTLSRLILKSYSRNISTKATLKTIYDDVAANENIVDIRTIDRYLKKFEQLFVVDELSSWSPKIRSKATIRVGNTRQICDPSLAVASLSITPEELLNDYNTFGLLFESLCIRDLRNYASALDGDVFYYLDSSNLEVDAIIHLNNGKWGAIEIKLGSEDGIESGAKNLIKLSNNVDIDKMNPPSFLMVLTATNMAYKRNDGVYVVPITLLKD